MINKHTIKEMVMEACKKNRLRKEQIAMAETYV